MNLEHVQGVTITTDAKVVLMDDISLERLQSAVGGYITSWSTHHRTFTVFCADDATAMEYNPAASILFGNHFVGNIVVTGGVDGEGNTLPIHRKMLKQIMGMVM